MMIENFPFLSQKGHEMSIYLVSTLSQELIDEFIHAIHITLNLGNCDYHANF